MRGEDISQPKLFITTTVTDFVPKSHPLRSLRKLLDAALKELTEAGYASLATPLDKLATLTVEQLSPLAAETDVPKSGSKARKLRAIGEQVEGVKIERHLQGIP